MSASKSVNELFTFKQIKNFCHMIFCLRDYKRSKKLENAIDFILK